MRYFKRPQRDGLFNFYELLPEQATQVMISFLGRTPAIEVVSDNADLYRATQEVGIPILRAEYMDAYHRAFDHPHVRLILSPDPHA